MHAHTHTNTRTHARAQTHTHTHTHTHTFTYTQTDASTHARHTVNAHTSSMNAYTRTGQINNSKNIQTKPNGAPHLLARSSSYGKEE
eukprot:jgi/Botrbrau1/18397/Bobra.0776s0003.1